MRLGLLGVAMAAMVVACSGGEPVATTCGGTKFEGACLVMLTPAQDAASTCTASTGNFAVPLFAGQSQFTVTPNGEGGGDTCTQSYSGCSLTRSCLDHVTEGTYTIDITFAADGTLTGTYATTTADGTSTCAYEMTGGNCH